MHLDEYNEKITTTTTTKMVVYYSHTFPFLNRSVLFATFYFGSSDNIFLFLFSFVSVTLETFKNSPVDDDIPLPIHHESLYRHRSTFANSRFHQITIYRRSMRHLFECPFGGRHLATPWPHFVHSDMDFVAFFSYSAERSKRTNITCIAIADTLEKYIDISAM